MHLDRLAVGPSGRARAMACHSVVGLSCGSQMTTTDAAWMLRPTPPATICETSTAPCPAAENWSTMTCRAAAGTEPVSGPKTWPGQGPSDLVEDVAEVGEHDDPATVVLGLLDDLHQSLHLLGLCARATCAACRMAMKFPAATASR